MWRVCLMRSTTGIDSAAAIVQCSRSLISANAACWAPIWNESYPVACGYLGQPRTVGEHRYRGADERSARAGLLLERGLVICHAAQIRHCRRPRVKPHGARGSQ